ncbi:tetratricopeptide repeat protein [Actinosynnema sp. NPDC053489]|uniref:tetratricopeptide repeat protein n=1 Tax=Actinosynnema sp. NPDC053489 TaxID=3363916 RepID=UPI0037CA2321
MLLSVEAATEADPTGLAEVLLGALAVLSPGGTSRRLLHEVTRNLTRFRDEAEAAADAVLGRLAEESIVTFDVSGGLAAVHRVTGRVLRDRLAGAEIRQVVIEVVVRALERFTAHDLERHLPERAWVEHLAEQVDAVRSHDLDDDHARRVLRLRRSIGGYHLQVGDDDRAITVLTEVVDEYRARSEDAGDDLRLSMTSLAQALGRVGRHGEAIAVQEEVLAAACARHGHVDPVHVALTRSNLAHFHRRAGNVDEALWLERRSWQHRRAFLGVEHPSTLMAQLRVGVAHLAAGDVESAIRLLDSAESTCARVDPGSLLLLDLKVTLASAQLEAGRQEDGITRYEAVLADWSPSWGAVGDQSHVLVVAELVALLRATGRHGEALTHCEAALHRIDEQVRVRAAGLRLRGELAELHHGAGRTGEAARIYEAMARDAERVYGRDHPITRDCRERWAWFSGRQRAGVPATAT